MEINGIAALVSGGAQGLGGATATHLAALGAKVTILDMNDAPAEARAHSIGGQYVRCDISDDDAVAVAVAIAEEAHGVARILVNCAGVAPAARTVGKGSAPHPMETFRRAINVNLIGSFSLIVQFACRLSVADVGGEEQGVIVNTASVAAFDGQVGQAAYAASKAAIVGLTLPVARDLAQHRIRVVTIAPGLFRTPMMDSFPQDVQDSLGEQVPHPRRLGRPEEYASLVESIVTNPMLNGETIRLDGAIRMAPR